MLYDETLFDKMNVNDVAPMRGAIIILLLVSSKWQSHSCGPEDISILLR